MKKANKITSFQLEMAKYILGILVLGIMLQPIHSNAKSWTEDAKIIEVGQTNYENTDTSSDDYYFEAPAKMKYTITIKIEGSRGFYYFQLDDQDENYVDMQGKHSYDKKKNQSTMKMTKTLNKGGYYIIIKDYLFENPKDYEVTVTAKLASVPTITSAVKKSSSAVLKFKKVSGCSGYEIYRKTGSGAYDQIAVIDGSKRSFTNKKLKKKKTYTYKIRAYKEIGGETYYSPYSKTAKVRI